MHEPGFNHFTNYGKRLGWIGFVATFACPFFTYKQINFPKVKLLVKDNFFAIVSTISCKSKKPLTIFLNMSFEWFTLKYMLFKSAGKPEK